MMKPLSEQDHYEILEIPRDAAPDEIERSFRMAQVTWADDSLAGYSVFGEGEAQAIRERIEIAYRVLSEAEARSAYDATLPAVDPLAAQRAEPPRQNDLPELPDVQRRMAAVCESEPHEAPGGGSAPAAVDECDVAPEIHGLEALEGESGEFDGSRLRRWRLRCGVELEEISGITKISPSYLRFIEEDRYAELPAPVYVRGFVTAYADCVGLDAKRVAASYMRKFDAETASARRGRFLGGR
jgi:curved DNA-binding protein CbpA